MNKFKHNKHNFLFFFTELRKFLRIEVCIVIVFMTLSGYLIFNKPGFDMLLLSTAMFFASSALYAYNHYTDKKEDLINNKRLNFFVSGRKGYYIILVCSILSFASSLYLSFQSLAIYLIAFAASFFYSVFKVKNLFPIKNLYSGFFMSTSFLIGAAAGNRILAEMIPYFLLVFLIGLTGNLIGDIRGYGGDRLAKVRTIPVVLGVKASKKIVHFNFGLFSLASVLSGCFMLMPIIPSLAATSFFVKRDDHVKARTSMISTFFILFTVLAVMKILGV